MEYNEKEIKFLRLALDKAAKGGEITVAGEKFITSLRARGVLADEILNGNGNGLSDEVNKLKEALRLEREMNDAKAAEIARLQDELAFARVQPVYVAPEPEVNAGDYLMSFGKHRGKKLRDLSFRYLKGALFECTFRDRLLKRTIKIWLLLWQIRNSGCRNYGLLARPEPLPDDVPYVCND